jgi:AraC-like DNA-binding protein
MFILVYMLLPRGFMKVYNVWYIAFMLYFSANFISFLGSHKLLLDAFAYKALSGQDKILPIRRKKKVKVNDEAEVADKVKPVAEAEIKKLERALDKWVKQKKFCEFDKSRSDVVAELGTTKELLHLYFSTHVGKDFKTWRTELRIEEAKHLLVENKELSTNVIAEIAGFSDRSNFHRQFVKLVGCTPRQWRDSGGAGCA